VCIRKDYKHIVVTSQNSLVSIPDVNDLRGNPLLYVSLEEFLKLVIEVQSNTNFGGPSYLFLFSLCGK